MPSVYLETTIPSFLVARVSQDDGLAEKQAITRTWWDRHRHRYELVTSEVVLVEAGSGDTSVAGQRLLAMQGIRVLADSPEVDNCTMPDSRGFPLIVTVPWTLT